MSSLNAGSCGSSKRGRDTNLDGVEVEAHPVPKQSRSDHNAPQPPIRPDCQYGQECYRRSPSHFKENRHKELEDLFVSIMKQNPEFNSLPVQVVTTDREVLLQQLKILRDLDLLPREREMRPGGQIGNNEVLEDGYKSSHSSELPTISSRTPEPEASTIPANNPGTTVLVSMLDKWESSLPYNFFLTRLPSEDKSTGFAVSFGELFHESLGEISAICHFNFLVEAEWFLEETMKASLEGKETTVIYGVESPELVAATEAFPWLKVHLAKSPFPFGHHHTKMILVKYTDESLRFIVSTANLTEADWENRTQGIWISPRCAKATEKQKSELSLKCPSNFQADLLQYLSSYPAKYVGAWTAAIRGADCSQIKVVFVGSAPTTAQSGSNGFQWGLKKVEKALRTFPLDPNIDPSWPLLMQCSSIATLGGSDEWVRGELGATMLGRQWSPSTSIRLIYPSDENVRRSFDGLSGGGCLPYSRNTHLKQTWVQKILHQWKASLRGRSRAVPHIKTYCRLSPDQTKVAWFLLTSANLSKAAWGKMSKKGDRLSVMSWEAGILFIPHLFDSSESFLISKTHERTSNSEFMVPYDIPLEKYGSSDTPWFIDTLLALRPQE